MSLALLFLLTMQQDQAGGSPMSIKVGQLVKEGMYAEAVAASREDEGSDGLALEVWVRHQAGDLTGALELAEGAMVEDPNHAGMLEQASYLSASLFRGADALRYADRLSAQGHPRAPELKADAEALLLREAEVEGGRQLALFIVAAFALLSGLLVRWSNPHPRD